MSKKEQKRSVLHIAGAGDREGKKGGNSIQKNCKRRKTAISTKLSRKILKNKSLGRKLKQQLESLNSSFWPREMECRKRDDSVEISGWKAQDTYIFQCKVPFSTSLYSARKYETNHKISKQSKNRPSISLSLA